MINATLRLTGAVEVDRVFRGLPLEVNHKVLQAAHADALKVTIDKAKLLAPEGPTGGLIDSLGTVKSGFAKANELGEVTGGPRRSRQYKGHAGHLVEYGTKARKNRRGANRGSMKAKPFMLPAWEATKDLVQSRINDAIGKKLYAFMKRTIKNQ